jgi:hypothetical protein
MSNDSQTESIKAYLELEQHNIKIKQHIIDIKQELCYGCIVTTNEKRIQLLLKTLSVDFALKLNIFLDKFTKYIYEPFVCTEHLPAYFPPVERHINNQTKEPEYKHDWTFLETFKNKVLRDDINKCTEKLIQCKQINDIRSMNMANEYKHSGNKFEITISQTNLDTNIEFNITFYSNKHKKEYILKNVINSFSIIIATISYTLNCVVGLLNTYEHIFPYDKSSKTTHPYFICNDEKDMDESRDYSNDNDNDIVPYFKYYVKTIKDKNKIKIPIIDLTNKTCGITYDIDKNRIKIVEYEYQLIPSCDKRYNLVQEHRDFIFCNYNYDNLDQTTNYINNPFNMFATNFMYNGYPRPQTREFNLFVNKKDIINNYYTFDNIQFLGPINSHLNRLHTLYKNKKYLDFYDYYTQCIRNNVYKLYGVSVMPVINTHDITDFYKFKRDDGIFEILNRRNNIDNIQMILNLFNIDPMKWGLLIKYINRENISNNDINNIFQQINKITIDDNNVNEIPKFVRQFLFSITFDIMELQTYIANYYNKNIITYILNKSIANKKEQIIELYIISLFNNSRMYKYIKEILDTDDNKKILNIECKEMFKNTITVFTDMYNMYKNLKLNSSLEKQLTELCIIARFCPDEFIEYVENYLMNKTNIVNIIVNIIEKIYANDQESYTIWLKPYIIELYIIIHLNNRDLMKYLISKYSHAKDIIYDINYHHKNDDNKMKDKLIELYFILYMKLANGIKYITLSLQDKKYERDLQWLNNKFPNITKENNEIMRYEYMGIYFNQ